MNLIRVSVIVPVLIVVSLLAIARPAASWDWTSIETSLGQSAFEPYRLVDDGNDGWWAMGLVGERPVFAHLDANMTVTASRLDMTPVEIHAHPSGDVVIGSGAGISRLDRAMNVRWSTRAYASFPGARLKVEHSGAIWQWDDVNLVRFSSDGAVRTYFSLAQFGIESIVDVAEPAQGGGLYLLGLPPNTQTKAIVAFAGSDQRVGWSWRDDAFRPADLAEGAAGDVVVVGTDLSAGVGRLTVSRLTGGTGQLRSRTTYTDIGMPTAMALRGDGAVVITARQPTGTGTAITNNAVLIAPAGSELWRRAITEFDKQVPTTADAGPVFDGVGNVWIAGSATVDASQPGAGVISIGSNGQLVASQPRFTTNVLAMQLASTGEVSAPLVEDRTQPGTTTRLYSVANFSSGGGIGTFAAVMRVDTPVALRASTISPAGDAFFVVANEAGGGHAYVRRGADGALKWRHVVTGTPESNAGDAFAADSTSICHGGSALGADGLRNVFVQCRAISTGNVLWERMLLAGSPTAHPIDLARDDAGDVIVLYSTGGQGFVTSRRRVYDRNGAIVSDIELPPIEAPMRQLATDRQGTSLIAQGITGRILKWIARDGTLKGQASTDSDDRKTQRAVIAGDGTTVYFAGHNPGASGSFTDARGFDTTGAQLWQRRIFDSAVDVDALVDSTTVYASAGDRSGERVTSGRLRPHEVQSIDVRSGQQKWKSALRATDGGTHHLALSTNGQRLVAIAGGKFSAHIATLDTATGQVLGERREACTACTDLSVSAGPADSVIVADAPASSLVVSYDNEPAVRAYRSTPVFVVAPPLDIATTHVEGIWFAPYELGQGVLVDIDHARSTFFMPWFTFQHWESRGFDNAEKRWYTVQGPITPGARALNLPIYRHDAGALASSRPVTTTQVGTAEVSFVSCREGTLKYHLNEAWSGFENGMITFSRAVGADTCASTPLDPPSGSTLGLDASQSGTWSNAAHASQGVLFDFGSPGVALGAWFTFTPEGATTRPDRHHWFTLQGPMTPGASSVTVPIYDTLGGQFDYGTPVLTRRVGDVTLTLTACGQMRMDYAFDAAESIQWFGALTGSIELRKFDGCR